MTATRPHPVLIGDTSRCDTQALVRTRTLDLLHILVSVSFLHPAPDVERTDFRCYHSQTGATATTATIAAGSQLGIWADQAVYHPGIVNVYMAKVPGL